MKSKFASTEPPPPPPPKEEPATTPPPPPPLQLSEEAFHGPLGKIALFIKPHTEADPAAILLQLIVAFGSIVGRNPFFKVESTKHHTNLFLVLNGQSSKARKGTAWDNIINLLLAIDFLFKPQIVSGLSTSEGIVNHLRDGPPGAPANGDKRMLVVETEFTRVLKVMSRQGNTLSTLLRDAWDKGDFQILTKNNPLKATNAHFALIGHTTNEDLQLTLEDCDVFNGFANRILWGTAKRARLLPHGGNLDREELARLAGELGDVISTASGIGEMKRDVDARKQWGEIYEALSKERPGMLGAVTNRAEAQVVRLSMIYALADGSSVIGVEHQNAALAVWAYCFDSAQRIFGNRVADSCARKILEELRRRAADGMTREEIYSELFKRNMKSDRIAAALKLLQDAGLAICKAESTGGRDAERWYASTSTT